MTSNISFEVMNKKKITNEVTNTNGYDLNLNVLASTASVCLLTLYFIIVFLQNSIHLTRESGAAWHTVRF